ncbi:fumarylacetoacetate hydrolase family protein [Ferruginibacter paludis]|uniref:fumarylacetoacetate hydrolase family protein n=1 Tax=Ferruginibacter paludis TaxID=1310417 RepID=UPI0025B2894E|nr:fumarylacetoacetate hydrolase family protein [Ferruginibacter paludis]MDN3656854.1 fumarylacetoacetate hydrolase family protein [Ferruginibacter paludis]
MKLLYFKNGEQYRLGIVTEKGILDADAYRQFKGQKFFSATNLTNKNVDELKKMLADGIRHPEFILDEGALTIASCTPTPSKIICIGLNYRRHAAESGMAVPTVPVVFTKYNNTLVDYGKDVPLGKVGEQFDYEVELGVVIGEKCKDVSKADALDYVLGYCVANDLSCRDLQFRTSQWLMGKSLDYFLPLGKYIVTKDEIPDVQQLNLKCTLNGELRQNSTTADMIFSVAEIIEDLSKHMTLEPGDLILTGTPEGVIMGMTEKNWLKPGDVVTVEIEGLGSTSNQMV